MNQQTKEAKSIWSEIANFTGEFIDENDNSSEIFMKRKVVGILTDEEKTIFTLLKRKRLEYDEIITSVIGREGLDALNSQDPTAIELYAGLLNEKATPETMEKLKQIERQIEAISKVFWGTVDYRLPNEEGHNRPTTRIEPGWEIARGMDRSDVMDKLAESMPFGFTGFGFGVMFKMDEEKENQTTKKE